MKKITYLILFIISILFFTSCDSTNTLKQQNAIQEIDFNDSYDLFDMTVAEKDGNIYVADKENIYIYNSKAGKWDSVIQDLELCRIIGVEKDKIFALDDGSLTLKYFNNKGVLKKEYPLEKGFGQKLLCYGDKVFLLFHSPHNDTKNYIMVLDINTGKFDKLEFDNISAFTKYSEDSILITLSTNEVIIYDINKMKTIDKHQLNISGFNPIDICYDLNDNLLYFIYGGGYIKKANIDTNVVETLFYDDNASFKNLRIHDDLLIVSDTKGKKIYKMHKNNISKEIQNIITIASISNYSIEDYIPIKKSIEIYNHKNPEHQFRFQVYGMNNPSLKAKLMSGYVDDIGIFFISNNLMSEYVINDIFYDLNNCPEITEKFNLMFDGLKDSLTYDGKLFGLPFIVTADAWKVNVELMSILNFDYPEENWTWDDFYIYAKKVRQDIDGDGKSDLYIAELQDSIPYFMDQYNSVYLDIYQKIANFNNEEFINLLKLWKRLFNEDLVENNRHSNNNEKENILFFTKQQYLRTGVEDNSFVYVPTLKSKRIYNNQIDLFAVNKKSYNIDACVDFLKIYLSDEVQRTNCGFGFYKNRSVYNPGEVVALGSLPLEITGVKNFELLNTILKHSKPNVFNVDFGVYLNQVIMNYLTDGMTAEEAACLIDKKAKIIVGE